jgi:pyruvate,orthophosphate dikinase
MSSKGRRVNPDLESDICGEHDGDPISIQLCHEPGLTCVSRSSFLVPIDRLAAAHAALQGRMKKDQ